MAAWDPGLAKYGNFIYYYKFNQVENRSKLLPEDIHLDLQALSTEDEVLCLDIGCNTGDLTVALYDHMVRVFSPKKTVRMLGVDLDPELICIAHEKNPRPDGVRFVCADVITHGIDFLLDEQVKSRFDVAFCFGVTMWIHLNHGDDGLRTFLSALAARCTYFFVEPQPWRCYVAAVRRQKRSRKRGGCEPSDDYPYFSELRWRESVREDIDSYLLADCSLRLVKQLGETEWRRHVTLYESSLATADPA